MTSKLIASALGMALLLALPMAARASAYKCTDTQGRVTFSDTPCPVTATSSKKIMERGAGYNPLTEQEKSDFRFGFMSRCSYPRNVCECIATQAAESLSYEELMQFGRAQRSAEVPGTVQKIRKIERACHAREAQQ